MTKQEKQHAVANVLFETQNGGVAIFETAATFEEIHEWVVEKWEKLELAVLHDARTGR